MLQQKKKKLFHNEFFVLKNLKLSSKIWPSYLFLIPLKNLKLGPRVVGLLCDNQVFYVPFEKTNRFKGFATRSTVIEPVVPSGIKGPTPPRSNENLDYEWDWKGRVTCRTFSYLTSNVKN